MSGFSLPDCPRYHPNSELLHRPGYYPNLSEQQLQALHEFSDLIFHANIPFEDGKENYWLKALRFLRARGFNVQKAFDMLKKDVEWRQDEGRFQLHTESAEDVLGCKLEEIYKYFPSWIQGIDHQGRPVAWRQFGKFEIWNVLKLTTMERLMRFHAWEGEQALNLMRERSLAIGFNIETFVIIIDAAGWHIGLATGDAFKFIRGMAVVDSDHYPERLGRLVVINAPRVLAYAWSVIAPMLDDVTKAKISICSSNPNEWFPILCDMMHRSQIPKQYGGDGPDPLPGKFIQLLDSTASESLHHTYSESLQNTLSTSHSSLIDDGNQYMSTGSSREYPNYVSTAHSEERQTSLVTSDLNVSSTYLEHSFVFWVVGLTGLLLVSLIRACVPKPNPSLPLLTYNRSDASNGMNNNHYEIPSNTNNEYKHHNNDHRIDQNDLNNGAALPTRIQTSDGCTQTEEVFDDVNAKTKTLKSKSKKSTFVPVVQHARCVHGQCVIS